MDIEGKLSECVKRRRDVFSVTDGICPRVSTALTDQRRGCCALFQQSVFDCGTAVRSRDCVYHRRSVALIVLEPRYV